MDTKINKAMELINLKKDEISKRKNNILIAETRREENLKSLEEDKKKIVALGYDPEKIDEVVMTMTEELKTLESELDSILENLESNFSV